MSDLSDEKDPPAFSVGGSFSVDHSSFHHRMGRGWSHTWDNLS